MQKSKDKERILIVDDDTGITSTLTFILEDKGYEVASVETGNRAVEILKSDLYDLVLVDYKLTDTTGIELAREINKINRDISIILITGHASLDSALEAIKENIYDYLLKPVDMNNLLLIINRALEKQRLNNENKRLMKELKEKNKELARLSITDDLTGLYNQRNFYKKLDEEMERALRQKHDLSLLFIDIDHFKSYNDMVGHLEGDVVLRKLGEIIINSIREMVDSGYRYGGDEFAIILPEADGETGKVIAERLRSKFEQCCFDILRLSIGITQYEENDTPSDFISRADAALYEIKAVGGNDWLLFFDKTD
ncbi:MAG: diguanylate cyclase [Elusimicrobiota bacterium]